MTQLPHSIELHDSEIGAIVREGDAVVVRFSRAYIHRDGKGWIQAIDLRIGSAQVECAQQTFPAQAWDGTLTTSMERYDNLLPIPLGDDGAVVFQVEFTSGAILLIEGTGLEMSLVSEPIFVEDVD